MEDTSGWRSVMIIIIAFRGAIRDFLQSPHSAVNCLQHVRSSGLGAIVCKSRATHRTLITCKCHDTCHLVRRDSSAIKFDRVEVAFIWTFILLAKPLNRWRRGGNRSIRRKKPDDELQKLPHTTARRCKPQARLEPAQQHWWQARKADMLTVTPRVAPVTSSS